MKFFTTDLYRRLDIGGNAATADTRAEWEQAVTAYHVHLGRFSGEMNDRVRKLAEEICLQDAEWICPLEEELVSTTPIAKATPTLSVSLMGIGRIYQLTYTLWAGIRWSDAPIGWPNSSGRIRWICDEIDCEPASSPMPRYLHRVLLSDGRVIVVPFSDVIVRTSPADSPVTAPIRPR